MDRRERIADRTRSIAFVASQIFNAAGYGAGGSEYQILQLARSFERDFRWRVVMVATRESVREVSEGEVPGVTLSFVGGQCSPWLVWPLTSLVPLLRADCDVYYQRGAYALTPATALAAWLRGRRFVWAVASDSDCEPRVWRCFWAGSHHRGLRRFKAAVFQLYLPPMRWALRRADLVVFQTERQCAHFGAGWHLAPMRHMILPSGHTMHGEDVSLAAPPERAVLWLGGIKDVKRPELFAVLARDLVKDGVQCRMAGRLFGRRQSAWLEAARRSETNLSYLGELTRSEVPRELGRVLALVNTSRVEGFPNTFVEAWIAGRPVASLGIDPDGVIQTFDLGFVASDIRGLATWIARLADDETLQLEYSERCRAYAHAHHDIDVTSSRLHAAVCSLV